MGKKAIILIFSTVLSLSTFAQNRVAHNLNPIETVTGDDLEYPLNSYYRLINGTCCDESYSSLSSFEYDISIGKKSIGIKYAVFLNSAGDTLSEHWFDTTGVLLREHIYSNYKYHRGLSGHPANLVGYVDYNVLLKIPGKDTIVTHVVNILTNDTFRFSKVDTFKGQIRVEHISKDQSDRKTIRKQQWYDGNSLLIAEINIIGNDTANSRFMAYDKNQVMVKDSGLVADRGDKYVYKNHYQNGKLTYFYHYFYEAIDHRTGKPAPPVETFIKEASSVKKGVTYHTYSLSNISEGNLTSGKRIEWHSTNNSFDSIWISFNKYDSTLVKTTINWRAGYYSREGAILNFDKRSKEGYWETELLEIDSVKSTKILIVKRGEGLNIGAKTAFNRKIITVYDSAWQVISATVQYDDGPIEPLPLNNINDDAPKKPYKPTEPDWMAGVPDPEYTYDKEGKPLTMIRRTTAGDVYIQKRWIYNTSGDAQTINEITTYTKPTSFNLNFRAGGSQAGWGIYLAEKGFGRLNSLKLIDLKQIVSTEEAKTTDEQGMILSIKTCYVDVSGKKLCVESTFSHSDSTFSQADYIDGQLVFTYKAQLDSNRRLLKEERVLYQYLNGTFETVTTNSTYKYDHMGLMIYNDDQRNDYPRIIKAEYYK